MIHFSGGYRKRALIFRISALLSCAIFSFSHYIFARLLSQTIDFTDFVGVSLSHPDICRSRLFIQFLPHMGRTKSWEKTLKKCGDNQSDGRERKKNFTDFVIYITQDLWYTLL